MFCHSRAAGFVLGLNTRQMNRDHDFGGVTDNQLRAYNKIGLFKQPLEKAPEQYPAFANLFDKTAGIEERVGAYLDVNCAMCHVNDGGGNSRIELSHKTPLDESRMIDEPPIHDTMGVADSRIVAPGDPGRSILYKRKWGIHLTQVTPRCSMWLRGGLPARFA